MPLNALPPLLAAAAAGALAAVAAAAVPAPSGPDPGGPDATGPAPPAAAAPAPGRWVLPLGGDPEVVRGFEAPGSAWGPGHRGVDLAGPAGAPVGAAGPGVVAWAGRVAGRGVVSVAHPGGLRSTYEPLVAAVAPGTPVAAGTPLGLLDPDAPGHCPGRVCLHWGVRRGGVYLDPLPMATGAGVVLLPFWPAP